MNDSFPNTSPIPRISVSTIFKIANVTITKSAFTSYCARMLIFSSLKWIVHHLHFRA